MEVKTDPSKRIKVPQRFLIDLLQKSAAEVEYPVAHIAFEQKDLEFIKSEMSSMDETKAEKLRLLLALIEKFIKDPSMTPEKMQDILKEQTKAEAERVYREEQERIESAKKRWEELQKEELLKIKLKEEEQANIDEQKRKSEEEQKKQLEEFRLLEQEREETKRREALVREEQERKRIDDETRKIKENVQRKAEEKLLRDQEDAKQQRLKKDEEEKRTKAEEEKRRQEQFEIQAKEANQRELEAKAKLDLEEKRKVVEEQERKWKEHEQKQMEALQRKLKEEQEKNLAELQEKKLKEKQGLESMRLNIDLDASKKLLQPKQTSSIAQRAADFEKDTSSDGFSGDSGPFSNASSPKMNHQNDNRQSRRGPVDGSAPVPNSEKVNNQEASLKIVSVVLLALVSTASIIALVLLACKRPSDSPESLDEEGVEELADENRVMEAALSSAEASQLNDETSHAAPSYDEVVNFRK